MTLRARAARLPLRLRLVAGFLLAMTVVLGAAGSFVYWRVAYALDRRLDADLLASWRALAPLVAPGGAVRPDAVLARLPAAQRYQVLDAHGRVLSAGVALGTVPLLTAAQAASGRDVHLDVGALLPVSPRPLRLLARPLPGPGPARVLLLAERRDQRDEALRELVAQLLLAGLGTLVVTTVVGERLARAALAPVERYRQQAVRIAGGAQGLRLDVPAGRDDEVTRLGHTLNDVLEELERALEGERRFTQDASHELRTPLTLLSTRLQLARRGARSVAEHEEALRELAVDVDALVALAARLLDVSTAEHRTGPLPCADLAAVAAEVGGERGLAVPTAGPLRVRLTDGQARQVVTNLLDNADRHGAGAVRVAVDRVGATAVLTLTDDGPGVAASFLPLAADRFARADVARALPGAGLGLSLVRALVDGAHGELRLCSGGAHHRYRQRHDLPCTHPDGGTTATVLLDVQT